MNDWATNEKHIREALTKIQHNWPRMIHTLPAGEKPEGGGGTHPSAPTPAPISILSLRRQIDERLAALVRAIRSENDLTTRPATDTNRDVTNWLLTWANWLSAQDWINEPKALPELTHLANRCEETALGYTVRRYRVGTCPEHTADDEGHLTRCTGELFALIRHEHDPKPSKLRCGTDGRHEWEEPQWEALHDRLTGRQERSIEVAYRSLVTKMFT